MKQCCFLIIISLISLRLTAQECKVEMETIKGTYTGECSGGKAYGKGKSVGTDQYEGDFKNGLPNGTGKYTWQNGDYYIGEWKKGMKEGKGEIHKAVGGAETVTKGYWKKDLYKGQSLKPYVIHDATTEIGRVEVSKIKDAGSSISIEVHSMSGGHNGVAETKDGVHEGTEVRATTTNISLKEIRVQGR